MLKETLSLNPNIHFSKPNADSSVSLCTFSDRSYPRDRDYGPRNNSWTKYYSNVHNIYHVIEWSSTKLWRVSYSYSGAEILAVSAADNYGFYYSMAFNSIISFLSIKHELNLVSWALFDTITTLHECREYRLRPTVKMLYNSFQCGDLHMIRWILGIENISNALTKRSVKISAELNNICTTGLLPANFSNYYSLGSETWR